MKRLAIFTVSCMFSIGWSGQIATKDEWGEKFNSSGARLVLKETGRARLNGQTIISYNMFVSGLPRDTNYTLWTRLVGRDPQEVADGFINQDGLVVSVLADPARNIAEDPINLKVVAGKGEPKQFALISNDSHYRAFGQVIPFPIENTVGSCHVSAIMEAANYSAVLIVLSGLQPEEELKIQTQSEGQQSEGKAAATAQGTYSSVVFPVVKGRRSGNARFSATTKSCSIGVEFPWGESSYRIQ